MIFRLADLVVTRTHHDKLIRIGELLSTEFFSLATPLEVSGKFSDFGVGIQTGGLFGTAINFVTSPVHVPFRRLAGEGLPGDGSDVCTMTIGPADRSTKSPAGCS